MGLYFSVKRKGNMFDRIWDKVKIRRLYLAGALCVFACAFLTAQVGVDYPKHAKLAMRMVWSDPVTFLRSYSEPLWHLMVRGLTQIPFINSAVAGGIVSGLCLTAAYLMAYIAFRKWFPQIGEERTAFLCTVLHLCCAIYVPFFNIQPYLGQSSPNIWHNPTLIMLRPLMLLFFILLGDVLQSAVDSGFSSEGLRLTWKKGLFLCVLLLLTNLAKPCFVQVFFPGIFFLMLIWLAVYRGKNLKLAFTLLAICLPSFFMLCFQLFKNFGSGEKSGAGIMIKPFYVAGLRTPFIPFSFLLLMAFPLVMLVITLRRRKLKPDEQLAGTMLLSGMLMWYLLAESGRRIKHGNFGWGYDSAVCLVWFLAMRSYLELCSLKEKSRRETAIAAAVLGLHLISGLIYLGILIILRHGM